jgi:SAM-dependent methyltransferase
MQDKNCSMKGLSVPAFGETSAMSDLSKLRPLDRFSGLANLYANCRPDYPAAAIDFVIEHCGLAGGSLLVDIGSGTGISSRQFAERGLRVLGIEPNADMRRQASEDTAAELACEARDGRAETTGLADSSADGVVAAQAFHWFVADAALREFFRILRPSCWVVLMWNERDETDPATAAYGNVVGRSKEATSVEGPRRQARKTLGTCPLFQNAEQRLFGHTQIVDEEGLLGRAFSASYAPREVGQKELFAAALREVFARFQQRGVMQLKYLTSVDVAQRIE